MRRRHLHRIAVRKLRLKYGNAVKAESLTPLQAIVYVDFASSAFFCCTLAFSMGTEVLAQKTGCRTRRKYQVSKIETAQICRKTGEL